MMSPVVITLPDIYGNEADAYRELMKAGAEIIHLRKPGYPHEAIRSLLDNTLAVDVRHALTIHYDPSLAEEYGLGGIHLKADDAFKYKTGLRKSVSCHSWDEVVRLKGIVDYVFLSPVFDSVSKEGYKKAFAETDLCRWLSQNDRPRIVALSGITVENIHRAKELGFDSAAAIGSIWEVKNGRIDIGRTVNNFNKLKENWEKDLTGNC